MRCTCGQKAVPGYTQCYPCWERAHTAACTTMTPEDKARIDAMAFVDDQEAWDEALGHEDEDRERLTSYIEGLEE